MRVQFGKPYGTDLDDSVLQAQCPSDRDRESANMLTCTVAGQTSIDTSSIAFPHTSSVVLSIWNGDCKLVLSGGQTQEGKRVKLGDDMGTQPEYDGHHAGIRDGVGERMQHELANRLQLGLLRTSRSCRFCDSLRSEVHFVRPQDDGTRIRHRDRSHVISTMCKINARTRAS